MRLHHEIVYAATPAQVYEMRADLDFRALVCEALDTVSHEVRVDGEDPFTISIDMVQHTKGMPSFAKKFAGDQTRVIQTERWHGIEAGHIEVDVLFVEGMGAEQRVAAGRLDGVRS